ncbi:glycosyltransferase family 2 protein [Bacillus luti]|uniref:glycosyltransferase family 2 protein n=1 Tax=Bacillus luti TaxID=2026191 RepID=UPI0012E7AC12|nr:glycosyltransferase family A protein [Bacillus luti]
MAPTLTVFTPTFNRAYTLHLCYESLKRQTCKDFVWLVIDDGSTDNTKDLIERWIAEDIITIIYHYQENQGMHGAHNAAYELIDTKLNVCIDSDDYMADDAVEKILSIWEKSGSEKYAGIVGLDANRNGRIIGTKFPSKLIESKLSDLYTKYKVSGDKKLVYRSEITARVPSYPMFPGEKYCPLSYKYILIDQECPLLVINEVLCYVEYLEDGSSMNIINQYRKNPRGFSFFRKTAMKYAPSFKERFRESMHYVSSNLMIKNYKFLKESPCKGTTFLAIPFGVLFYMYILNTNRATVLKK